MEPENDQNSGNSSQSMEILEPKASFPVSTFTRARKDWDNWIKRTTKCKKISLGVIAIFLCIVIIIILATTIHFKTHKTNISINCSIECQEVLKQTQLHMDMEFSPCEDFYKYACGGYMKQNAASSIPWLGSRDSFDDLEERDEEIIQRLIDSLEPSTNPERKLKLFYKSCLALDPFDNAESIKECAGLSRKFFPDIVSRLFVKSTFLHKGKEEILSLILETIRKSYIKKISSVNWLDDESKKKISEKIRNLRGILGYPEELLNQTKEFENYKDLDITLEDYVGNVQKLSGKYANAGEESVHSMALFKHSVVTTVANAYYSLVDDKFVIPAAISQKPIFHKDYPPVINFARLGWIIGHELSHAFSTYVTGIVTELTLLTGNVTIEHSSAATNESKENYKKLLDCVKDQYDGFRWNNMSINGTATLDENFADLAGFQVAYQAYMDNYSEDYHTVPGFESLTHEQLFFVGTAQSICRAFDSGKLAELAQKIQIEEGEHSPAEIRVFGEMRNSVEFSKAFNCPVGSNYNPKERCKIF